MSLADKKQTNQRFRIFFKKTHTQNKRLNYHAYPKYLADTKRRRVATSDSLWRHGKISTSSPQWRRLHLIAPKIIFQLRWMFSDEKFTARPQLQQLNHISWTALIPTVHIKTIITMLCISM